MKTFKYVGHGNNLPGLPAMDLQDDQLSLEQKALMVYAVALHLYEVQGEKPKEAKDVKPGKVADPGSGAHGRAKGVRARSEEQGPGSVPEIDASPESDSSSV